MFKVWFWRNTRNLLLRADVTGCGSGQGRRFRSRPGRQVPGWQRPLSLETSPIRESTWVKPWQVEKALWSAGVTARMQVGQVCCGGLRLGPQHSSEQQADWKCFFPALVANEWSFCAFRQLWVRICWPTPQLSRTVPRGFPFDQNPELVSFHCVIAASQLFVWSLKK